jgi:hypothetical protein
LAVIAYRWHPLYGQQVTRLWDKQISERPYVVCQLSNGEQHPLPAWMLDSAHCAQHSDGAPMLSLPALHELRRVLDSFQRPAVCDGRAKDLSQEDSLGTHPASSTPASSSIGDCGPTADANKPLSPTACALFGGPEPSAAATGSGTARRRRPAGGPR